MNWYATSLRVLAAASVSISLMGCGLGGGATQEQVAQDAAQGARFLVEGKEQPARVAFDRALKHGDHVPSAYALVISACAAGGRNDLALKYADGALRDHPTWSDRDKASMHTSAGAVLQQDGKLSDAVVRYKEAMGLDPSDAGTMNNLAYAYAEMPPGAADLKEAERLANEAVRLAQLQRRADPEVGTFLDTLGWVYFQQRAVPSSIRTLSRAAELCASEPDVHYHLATALAAGGKKDEAIAVVRRALRLDPKHAGSTELLERLDGGTPVQGSPAPARPGQRPASPVRPDRGVDL